MEIIKQGKRKFYIGENEEDVLAEMTINTDVEDRIIIEHTFVSDTLKGQGIGPMLLNKVVEYARENNKKIVPMCGYANKLVSKTDEYNDVVIKD